MTTRSKYSADRPSRSDIDIATGIVIGFDRTTPEVAFAELVATARIAGVSVFELARAVTGAACGQPVPASVASAAVDLKWGHMLTAGSGAQLA